MAEELRGDSDRQSPLPASVEKMRQEVVRREPQRTAVHADDARPLDQFGDPVTQEHRVHDLKEA
ncbi:hypothetical protein ABZS66_27210 [Dactylosporangium sp. NPDC005572]|uniref:hypothetical protein n=1 Tax=Dactylosporangium sp. NPDC005572 TaxID=3156889 RepID=UPI0033BB5256